MTVEGVYSMQQRAQELPPSGVNAREHAWSRTSRKAHGINWKIPHWHYKEGSNI
jgi:hypothetical protein